MFNNSGSSFQPSHDSHTCLLGHLELVLIVCLHSFHTCPNSYCGYYANSSYSFPGKFDASQHFQVNVRGYILGLDTLLYLPCPLVLLILTMLIKLVYLVHHLVRKLLLILLQPLFLSVIPIGILTVMQQTMLSPLVIIWPSKLTLMVLTNYLLEMVKG